MNTNKGENNAGSNATLTIS